METTTTTNNESSAPHAKHPQVWVSGPIIVGAGPSGLAVAASLRLHSIPSIILEKADTIAPLWRHRTYDRLCLHLPKPLCELPHLPFPSHFPNYPSKQHFLSYLLCYAQLFSLRPHFCHTVTDARYDPSHSVWRVTTTDSAQFGDPIEFISRWLVVATGENAEPIVPELAGIEAFVEGKKAVHSSDYKTGGDYRGKKVLVIGCGNSGMEVCLDLCEHGAMPFMSVRSGVHILPREMFGMSTYVLAMKLLKWLPVRIVDRFLLMVAKRMIGDTEKYGLKRPKVGPIELKNTTGRTPVLDVGTLANIKNGRINIVPEVESLTSKGAKFVDGREMDFDSLVFATGYRSNVPSWLKDSDFFTEDGKPKAPFPSGWKGENGLYVVGFTGKGLLGTGSDAVNIAQDIARKWKNTSEDKNFIIYTHPS
ncbi:indole-3-pyruvate monooxygenase YUCCA8-like [Magnolia sinica]|uniref:indole-3-pyruvate monooxygenase YUCCA8-like n=1 Tax=Magnolia sinica TaxID=86752 RepID=UPI0026584AEE|nr:indole-3-pyruvate monooxygenase YUCCA8-like [Magnolia sinica]